MSKPICVVTGDVHYNMVNLELADKGMRMAIETANRLGVPLVVNGDLNDTKANLRAECVNRMLTTFGLCNIKPYINVGNHDLINERSADHSLEFLRPFATIIDTLGLPVFGGYGEVHGLGYFVPYYSDVQKLREHLKAIPKGSRVFMHQGLTGTNSGEYFQDKSAITHDDVAGLRVISGHYHTRQTIQLPDGGVWDYVGNPFTTSFGEASDPEKGYQILMDDGTLEFVPTNLRKHVSVRISARAILDGGYHGYKGLRCNPDDLVLVKLDGTREDLNYVSREDLVKLLGVSTFRFDTIPTDSATPRIVKSKSNDVMLDAIIDGSDYTDERKAGLKQLWRSIIA